MKKDWQSLLWCVILVGANQAADDERNSQDQCKDRLSRYYRSHFEDENELHVPNACQSCCCSNNTNQVHIHRLDSHTPDFRPINKFCCHPAYATPGQIRKVTHSSFASIALFSFFSPSKKIVNRHTFFCIEPEPSIGPKSGILTKCNFCYGTKRPNASSSTSTYFETNFGLVNR